MDVKINNICQCCLAEGCERELYREYKWLDDKEVYGDMLANIFNINVPNGFICEDCIIHLRQSGCFKNKVVETQECFQGILHSGGITDAKVVVKKSDTSNDNYISDVVKIERFEEEYLECNENDNICEEIEEMKEPAPKVKYKKEKLKKKETILPKKRKRAVKEVTVKVPKKKIKVDPDNIHITSTHWEMPLSVRENVATLIEFSTITPFVYMSYPGSFKCLYCFEPYKDLQELLSHTRTHDNIDKRSLILYLKGKQNVKADISELNCKICSQEFNDINTIRRHLVEEHDIFFTPTGNGIIPFKIQIKNGSFFCHLCSKLFHSFFLLNTHNNSHYGNAICDICGLGFVSFGRLLQHKQMHLTKEIPCTKCDRKYGSTTKLQEHMKKVHSLPKRKTSKCTHCEERFADHYKKLTHLRVEHNITFKFECDSCQKVFESRKALTRHTTKVHMQTILCDVCKKSFTERTVLKNHMAMHFEERNFHCSLCDKTYKYEKNLKYHMKRHNPNWNFACSKCKVGFPNKMEFRKHKEAGCEGPEDISEESYIPAEEVCV